MWATIYHVQSGSSVGSFVPLLRDLGSGEGISADYCHQKTSLLGRVASHQSTGMVTDWIVGKVIPSDLEAVEPGFCSEDKNAQNMNSCTNLEVFLSHRQEQSFQAILETERLSILPTYGAWMQLTGQRTPLETREVHPEEEAEQAAFAFLVEPQQPAPLSAKLLSCGVSNRGLRKTAAEASVSVHKVELDGLQGDHHESPGQRNP